MQGFKLCFISILHKMVEKVDSLLQVFDRESLINTVETCRVPRVHVCRGEAEDIPGEASVVDCVCVADHGTCAWIKLGYTLPIAWIEDYNQLSWQWNGINVLIGNRGFIRKIFHIDMSPPYFDKRQHVDKCNSRDMSWLADQECYMSSYKLCVSIWSDSECLSNCEEDLTCFELWNFEIYIWNSLEERNIWKYCGILITF